MAISGLTSTNSNMDVRKLLAIAGTLVGDDALALLRRRLNLCFTESLNFAKITETLTPVAIENCEVYLLLSLLPLQALLVLVLQGGIGRGAAALSRTWVGIGLRQLSLNLRRVRVRVRVRILSGEDGEPGGAFDQRGVWREGQVGGGSGGGDKWGQRVGFRIMARWLPGSLRRVEELDGLRGRELEQRSEGTSGIRRRSYDALDFLVELNGFERGLLHYPIEPDRTEPDRKCREMETRTVLGLKFCRVFCVATEKENGEKE